MPDGETGGFLERLRNSPRTVSTIIVILIVVGAIFAFSDRGEQPETARTSEEATAGAPSAVEEAATETEAEGAREETPEATVAEAEAEAAVEPAPPPPEATETATAYTEVAARGEGVTHLARRAMLRYLETNPADFTVTAEHKIWIEDALKDRIGSRSLGVGEAVNVEKDLIREAIGTSKTLTDAQRKSLERFSQSVAAYRSA